MTADNMPAATVADVSGLGLVVLYPVIGSVSLLWLNKKSCSSP